MELKHVERLLSEDGANETGVQVDVSIAAGLFRCCEEEKKRDEHPGCSVFADGIPTSKIERTNQTKP